jgi:hypothetical protein
MGTDTLKRGFDTLNEHLSSMLRNMLADRGAETEYGNSTEKPLHSVSAKAIEDAALLRQMTKDLYELFYRETASLENTLTFAMPLFPVDVVTELHDIRKSLIEYRGSLQDMLNVLAGSSDHRVIARAKQSALDFSRIIAKIEVLGNSSMSNGGEILKLLASAQSLAKIGAQYQRNIAEKLVMIFAEAREHDANIDKMGRRSSS